MDYKDNFSVGNNIPFEERLAIFLKQDYFTAFKQTEDITPILSALKTKKIVLGTIVKKVTGGFLVEFNNYEGFLPYTQFSKFHFAYFNSSIIIGSYYEFEIIKISTNPFLIILSRSTLQSMPEEELKKKEILLDTITKFIETNVKEIDNCRKAAIEILETANESYYDQALGQFSKEDIKLLSEEENILANRIDASYSEGQEFCGACQQSPCMCSDPERTSTVGF